MSKVNKEIFLRQYKTEFNQDLDFKANKEKKLSIFQIIDAFDADEEMKSLRWLAYILATSMHESNGTFRPVVEGYWIKPPRNRVSALYNYYMKNNPGALSTIFPNGKTGIAYYGRGRVVQLTHNFNYRRASREIYGDDRLIKDPDLIIRDAACDMAVTFKGMLYGWFTGYKLPAFFPLGSNRANWRGARKIINGMDKASLIAGYAMKFYDCLEWEEENEKQTPEL